MMFVINPYMAEGLIVITRLDRVGQRYGSLLITEMLYGYKCNKTYVKCKCDCGNEIIKLYSGIVKTNHPSCGCMRKNIMQEVMKSNIVGKKFGKLTVVEMIPADNYKTKVRCKCDCGNEVILQRTHVVSGHTKSCGCILNNYVSKDFSGYISDYGVEIIKKDRFDKKSGWTLWQCKCGICESLFLAYPFHIINGFKRSCGCVKKSSREILIEQLLKQSNMRFDKEYIFQDCKDNGWLRFDFALLDLLGNVTHLIEYDGSQHFIAVEMWGGEKGLEKQIYRDKIKDDYCVKNNIPLLRLPYTLTDDEIKEKITNIINP